MTGLVTCTNLAWPEDPYRTGQQLFRKPGPMVAAFTLAPALPAWVRREALVSAAVAYLLLHRTRTVTITGPELAFGFRVVSTADWAALPELARAADLDLARAGRHAAVLAGLGLAGDLDRLQSLAGGQALRGAAAVLRDWAGRDTPARGKALMVDCGLDLPAGPLDQACQQARISLGAGWDQTQTGDAADVMMAAAGSTGRALMIALLAGRHLGRISWPRDLDITEIITASAWDQFPHLRPRQAGTAAPDRGLATAQTGGTGAA